MGSVTHLAVRCGDGPDGADGADVQATPTAQSAAGKSAANVPIKSGDAETRDSS